MVWVAAGAGVDGNALGAGNVGEGARFSVGATVEDVAIDVGRLPTAVGSPDDAETPAVGAPLPDTDVEVVLHATSAKSAIAIVSPMRIVVLPSRLYVQYCRSVIDVYQELAVRAGVARRQLRICSSAACSVLQAGGGAKES